MNNNRFVLSALRLPGALLISTAAAATSFASAALAQDAAPPPVAAADAGEAVETIVVTGTRLQASGFTAPTPVTVTGSQAIENRAKLNVAEALNEIPAFIPSSGPSQATRNFSAALGFSTVDLRGLGAGRTLVLLDGRRLVPGTPSGLVDVSVIPTNLIDRVETVTGGASAAYGSDAVAGVVNFVLRDRLEGVRGGVQAGTSEHGGNTEYGANIAVGHGFLDDKLHVIAGVDWSRNDGILSQYEREWGAREAGYVGLSANRPAGVPANVLGYGHHMTAMTPGGIINNGPLRGTAFGPGGVPFKWDYGTLAGPTYQLGGDGFGYSDSSIRHLVHPTERLVSLVRLNYDVSPTTTLYVEGGFARGRVNTQGSEPRTPDPVLITLANPYIPAATRAAMVAAGITSFNLGRYSDEFGPGTNEAINKMQRGVVGAKGTIFGKWNWEAFVGSGRTITHAAFRNASSTRFYQAVNAVMGPNGVPVCGDVTTTPWFRGKDANRQQQILDTINFTGSSKSNVCAPFNPFGKGSPSQASIDYIRTEFDQRIIITQNVAAANVSGSPFSTWAGPVQVAFGAEGRRDGAKQNADNCGINACNDGVNLVPLEGSSAVYEFFGETGIPLLKDSRFGRSLEFNGAIRRTHYRYSGWVTTWKVGGTYEPTDWLRLRATQSRDIAAPSVTQLFQLGAANGLAITHPITGVSASVRTLTTGNRNLEPETGDTFTGGFVLTPRGGLLDGLRLSMDYYHISVKGVIGSVGGAEVVRRYFVLGQKQYADFITFDNSDMGFSFINVQLQNLTQRLIDGIDLEASYRVPIDRLNLPGRFNISTLVSWTNRFQTIDDSTGTRTVVNQVGYGIPRWRTNTTFNYDLGRFSTTLSARSFSGSRINRSWIGPDDPTYNPALPNSTNYNHAPRLMYWNLSARYDIIREGNRQLQLYAVVNNLFDKDPPIVAMPLTEGGGIQYDFVGRDFKVGARFVY